MHSPFDPDRYLEETIASESNAEVSSRPTVGTGDAADDSLAMLGPVMYYSWTNASPEQVARQAERCWRENVPGWRIEVADSPEMTLLCAFHPTGMAH